MKTISLIPLFFLGMLLNFSGCRDIFGDETQPESIVQPPSEASNIFVTNPVYGTILNPGDTVVIKWSAPTIQRIDIQLFRKSEYKFTLAVEIENDGSFIWKIPFEIQPSHHYRIKIITHNHNTIYAFSDQFGILNL